MNDRPGFARSLVAGMVAVISLAAYTILLAEPDLKKALPDAAARSQAEKLVQEVFQEDFTRARGDAAALRKLAATLLEQARETKDDAAARFVLFRDAAELAAQAGDISSAMNWVNEVAREYIVDAT